MPTNRRRRLNRRRQDITELTFDHRYELLHGCPMLTSGGFQGDRDAFIRAWELHGERLTAEYIAENPGRRPFACWVLEHKKERPIIIRDYDPGDLKQWEQLERETYGGGLTGGNAFGFLHSQCYGGRSFGPFQEEECDYLERHGLLTAAEREALAAM